MTAPTPTDIERVSALVDAAEQAGKISWVTRACIDLAMRDIDHTLAAAFRAIALNQLAADRRAWEPDVDGQPCTDGEVGEVVLVLATRRPVFSSWAMLCRGVDTGSVPLRRGALFALTGADPLGRPEPLPATVQALRHQGWIGDDAAYVVAAAIGGTVDERKLALRLLAEHADDVLYGDAGLVDVPQHLIDPVLVELMPRHTTAEQRLRHWHRILEQVRLLRHWSRVHSFGAAGDGVTQSFEIWLGEALLAAALHPGAVVGPEVTR